MTPKPSYSLDERNSVHDTLVYIAEVLTRKGVNAIIDATENLRRYLENARKLVQCFIEVHLECPLNVCMEREARRGGSYHALREIYIRAKEGSAPIVPGVGQPYKEPGHLEVRIDTTKSTPKKAATEIYRALRRKCLAHES